MERTPKNEQLNFKRRAGVALVGAIAAGASMFTLTNNSGAQEGIPCDPNIDNGCVVDDDGTLPTLPEKVPTTVPEVTTTVTTIPETTTTTEQQPPVTIYIEPPVVTQPPIVYQPAETK